ncbi:MAG: YkgJ family cysteine cluster protein, partial [Desulfobulbaceae bacterium]|nr:YkgJ family cysteine cluster protein [Desulfobulbaceae bacterium]
DEEGNPLDPMEALALYVGQQLLTRELEAINSLLCAPCGCTLCCTGPDDRQQQDFFEIPLRENEPTLFALPQVDNTESRKATPYDEPPLINQDQPFYKADSAALYHWRSGWSLILPRHTSCPHLAPESGHCTIYPQRPDVCRRPQIFAYALERDQNADVEIDGRVVPGFIGRSKLLAIWDCPYVKRFQKQIGEYADSCGLEPVFKENKS